MFNGFEKNHFCFPMKTPKSFFLLLRMPRSLFGFRRGLSLVSGEIIFSFLGGYHRSAGKTMSTVLLKMRFALFPSLLTVLRPLYDLIGKGGGALFANIKGCLRWWPRALPAIMPRLIASYRGPEESEPFRIYSDATGEGTLASISFPPPKQFSAAGAAKGLIGGRA